MTDPQPPGRLALYDAALPALSDGLHTITVTDSLNPSPSGAVLATASLTVEVAGPQFQLTPGDVVTVDPPARAVDVDPSAIASVVLRRETLPWERVSTGSAPWLALLVLDDSEATITRNTALPAGIATATAAPAGQLCDLLTIAAALQVTIPRPTDLPLLCHVRQVSLDAGGDSNDPGDGFFAAVFGARLPNPTAGTLVRACLVSLEGRSDLFGAASADPIALILLHDWTFTVGSGLDFGAMMDDLAAGAAPLAHGPQNPTRLVHAERAGTTSGAAYHGPLIADSTTAEPITDVDLSAAAATELGRMITAADRSLVRAVSDWYRADVLGSTTSVAAAGPTVAPTAVVERVVPAALQRLAAPPRSRWAPEREASERGAPERAAPTGARPASAVAGSPRRSLTTRIAAARSTATVTPTPPAVLDALCGYASLSGLPLLYIVADPQLLPDPSLRFVTLDADWIEAFVAGALSVSASGTSGDAFLARHLAPTMQDVWTQLAGAGTAVCGVLLRSPLVSAYPQMQIRAFGVGADGKPPAADADPADAAVSALQLRTVRYDAIGPDLLLALFAGTPAAIWFEEPHHRIGLRIHLADAEHAEDYVTLLDGSTVAVPWRAVGSRVIDIAALASAVGATGPGSFARLLMAAPVRQVFTS